jgi:hypothetical protein
MKKTAVEWLVDMISYTRINSGFFEKTKEMEKEQIKDSYEQGYGDGYRDNGKSGEQYYNETYGNK